MISRALLLLLLAGHATGQHWADLGPAPMDTSAGRVSAIAADPVNPSLYFVGGADGGVWRTLDGGVTWTCLSDRWPTSAIGAIALSGETVYVGTGEANFANHSRYGLGLFKSTDGGGTWAQIGQSVFGGRCFSRIIVTPGNPSRLYASITHAGGFPELAAAKGHPLADGPRGVFRSDDAGLTWTQLLSGLPNEDATDLSINPSNPQVLYAGIGRIFGSPDNGIYKTTDGGDTWTRLSGGFPTINVGRIALDVSPVNPQRVYVLVARACDPSGGNSPTLAALRTDTGGVSWQNFTLGGIQATYGWYLCVVKASPTSADTVIMGGYSLERSTNAGSTWSNITTPHVDNHAIAFDAMGRLLSGNDGGVHRSANLGTSWAGLNLGLGTAQFYPGLSLHPTDPQVVIGGNQDNGCNRRTTNSPVWSSLTGGDGGWTQIDQTNPLRMFTESQGTGSLYRSTNGGGFFTTVGAGLAGRNCFLPPYLIDPTNPQRMLYATERVFQSLDGGTSWLALSDDLTAGGTAAIRALEIAPSNPNFVYVATNDGRVLASTNGGELFALRLTGVQGWPRVTREVTADPLDPRTVYLAGAVFGAPHVRRSRDIGATWEVLDGDLPDIPVNTIGVDARFPGRVVFAGTDAGVYRSVNDGQSWREYGVGMPRASVVDVRVDGARSRLVVSTMGRGVWSAPIIYCYADFDGDGAANILDFSYFLNAFMTGAAHANCDASTQPPVLNVQDFTCFLNAFAAGCS